MRLSTERERPVTPAVAASADERAVAVLHAAFDAGITFLDTADAYCLDANDAGHNERLIARAIATWNGDRSGARTPVSADDVEVLEGRGTVLRRYQDEGWRLLGLSWQPEIADDTMSVDQVEAGFARMQELLDVEIAIEYCSHASGPPVCWCRKPLPGLGVVFIERYGLNPSQCIYVGAGPQDPGFARRLGFQYRDAEGFFDPQQPHPARRV